MPLQIHTFPVSADSDFSADVCTHWQANAAQFDFVLPESLGTFEGEEVHLEIRAIGQVGATGLLARATGTPTGSELTLNFTGPEMNQPVPAGAEFKEYGLWLYAQPTNEHVTLWKGTLKLMADETTASETEQPPDVVAFNLTQAQADLLYAPLDDYNDLAATVEGLGQSGASVLYTEQELTSEQKGIAATNIGLGVDDDVEVNSITLAGGVNVADELTQNAADIASNTSAIGALAASKMDKASNLADLTSASAARSNLGLGAMATSTDAANLTGNVAVARIATALTTPGAIGGTTASTINGTTITGTAFNLIPTTGVETMQSSGAELNFKYSTQSNLNLSLYGLYQCSDGVIVFSSSATTHASGRDIRMKRYAAGVMGFDDNSGNARDVRVRCVKFDRTDTPSGTTGAQTINKGAGSVNAAAAATSLVVTNSLVTASTIILATLQTNDATAAIKSVVAASGSFTIYLTAPTAETRIGWQLSA